MSYTEDTANDLADKALAEAAAAGDGKIVDRIGELLGASSQSLQEAYLTAVRVRRAEARAREMLAEAAEARGEKPAVAAEPPAKPSKPTPQAEAEPEVSEEPAKAKPKRKGW